MQIGNTRQHVWWYAGYLLVSTYWTLLHFRISGCVFFPSWRLIIDSLQPTCHKISVHGPLFVKCASFCCFSAAIKFCMAVMICGCWESVIVTLTPEMRGLIQLTFFSVKFLFHFFKVLTISLKLHFIWQLLHFSPFFVCSFVLIGCLDQVQKLYMLSKFDVCIWIVSM